METFASVRRGFGVATAIVLAQSVSGASAWGAHVVFDLPEAIECREVTPCDFKASHPNRKVIEAKFRVSARIVEGTQAEIVDFVYVLNSTGKTMHVHDYLPNTTLESAVAGDEIEITSATEDSNSTGAQAQVVYKPFTVGAAHNQGSKKSESNHYKQIASKDLVLASGTTNREHGVFFRLRPSRSGSLEGAKEFTFLATVPTTWRGDLCTISCTAKAKKTSLLSSSVVTAGAELVEVGMYLAGDAEAVALVDNLRSAQDAFVTLRHAPAPKDNPFETFSSQTVGFFTGKKPESQSHKQLAAAEQSVFEAQGRLKQLSR